MDEAVAAATAAETREDGADGHGVGPSTEHIADGKYPESVTQISSLSTHWSLQASRTDVATLQCKTTDSVIICHYYISALLTISSLQMIIIKPILLIHHKSFMKNCRHFKLQWLCHICIWLNLWPIGVPFVCLSVI